MTALDLAAIQARADTMRRDGWRDGDQFIHTLADIAALIAEVKRLQKELRVVSGALTASTEAEERLRQQRGAALALHFRAPHPYDHYCDLCGDTWPCPTVRALGGVDE